MSEGAENPPTPDVPRLKRGTKPVVQSHGGVLYPAQKGNPGGPGRPPNAGRSIKEKMNDYVSQGLTREQLAKIRDSRLAKVADVAAAVRLLRMMEDPDIAEYANLIDGSADLMTLRERGIDTRSIRKFKQRSRQVAVGDGNFETVIDREIELYDRSLADAKLVIEQTDGAPVGTVNVNAEIMHRYEPPPVNKLELPDAIKKRFAPSKN